jgi:hypothetical protein
VKLNGFGLALLAASEGGFTPEVMRTNNLESEPARKKPAANGVYAAKCERSATIRAQQARRQLSELPSDNRGDTAEINIPWTAGKSKALDAHISREMRRKKLEEQIRHHEARAAYWAAKRVA